MYLAPSAGRRQEIIEGNEGPEVALHRLGTLEDAISMPGRQLALRLCCLLTSGTGYLTECVWVTCSVDLLIDMH